MAGIKRCEKLAEQQQGHMTAMSNKAERGGERWEGEGASGGGGGSFGKVVCLKNDQQSAGSFLLSQSNLGIHCKVLWEGRGGRRWENLRQIPQSNQASTWINQDIIVIHLGGNSGGKEVQTKASLMNETAQHAAARCHYEW